MGQLLGIAEISLLWSGETCILALVTGSEVSQEGHPAKGHIYTRDCMQGTLHILRP